MKYKLDLGKCLLGELSVWEDVIQANVCGGIVCWRNYPSGNCPSRKCLWITVCRIGVCYGKVSGKCLSVQIPEIGL